MNPGTKVSRTNCHLILFLVNQARYEGFKDEPPPDPVPGLADEGSPGPVSASDGLPGSASASEGSSGSASTSEGLPVLASASEGSPRRQKRFNNKSSAREDCLKEIFLSSVLIILAEWKQIISAAGKPLGCQRKLQSDRMKPSYFLISCGAID
ncbi:hypothetical protein ILYODFUR_014509 [Ilyodon furcidens]|uniref:Uncharacterized protein n=1 Tax=Ilyodon furcidens TaxID=33524 RepID=A0ABV0TIM5_9TELE